jgi:hypothetical protein
MNRLITFFTFIVFLAANHNALAKNTVSSFTLPSGVEIKIVEAPLKGRKLPNCMRLGKAVEYKDQDYRPKTYVKSISGRYSGHTFSLDSSCMTDAWGERPLEYPGSTRYFGGRCMVVKEKLYCKLRGIFADGSESFVVEWYVSGGAFGHQTVTSSSGDIMGLFFEHIDPPEEEFE